ncbi:MAG: ROK family protein [Solirubrobacteraceae bacterium]|nr:ROK family protein [Solirubrobacteraceae bacterium]
MSAACVIGVDLGGTKLLAGLLTSGLRTVDRAYRLPPPERDAEVLLDLVVAEVRALERRARDAGLGPVGGVGVGIPSLVDRARGIAVSTVHQPLDGVPVRDLLQDRLQLPVALDNDGNCAMLAEWRAGGARGSDDAVLLALGTGIASGVVTGGLLVRGATGAATELGHMVVDLDGPPCQGACTSRGCLEALASGTALGRAGARLAGQRPGSALARLAADGQVITGQHVTDAARDGDAAAREALRDTATFLGVGIANVMNIFNPDVVLIGGGASAAGELLLGPAREEARRRARPPSNAARVEVARFGADAGMVGAGVLALEELS